jgi:hypothetical protein
MAKFTNKDLRLKDGEKLTLGTDLDANVWYDGIANQLAVDVTVSGITPTQDYHLTTKQYVDEVASTLSGSMVMDHGGLLGLGDDDHTQYVLADGTRAFSGTVGGVNPTEPTHLTTKQYVDSVAQGLDWQDSVFDFFDPTSGLPATPSVGNRYIATVTANGWTANSIYEWDGTSWVETVSNEGVATWNEYEDSLYVFNGTAWVKFGSTITHNNLSSIQGGTIDERYHLTLDEYNGLTSNSGIVDASYLHIHDDRYYTETEMDVTISGIQADISTYSDHGNLTGLGDDDHTQYTLADGSRAFTSAVSGVDPTENAHLTTKLYVDTISGTLQGAIDDVAGDLSSLQHDALGGLGDDDHTQYIRTDGLRGFTNTVSGIAPVADYDLATKGYVDTITKLKGRTAIADGASTVTVNFTDLGHTNYTVNATMENTSDSPPSIYAFIISAKTASSFNVTFMGDMDSANYMLNWNILVD